MTTQTAPATLRDAAERERANELVEAEHEHDAALAAWRRLDEDEAALGGSGLRSEPGRRVIRADGSERVEGRRTVRATIWLEGRERYVDELDEVERAALTSKIAAGRGQAARRLTTARTRLADAQRAVANAKLENAIPAYLDRVAAADAARREVEQGLGRAVRHLIEFGRTSAALNKDSRRLHRIAADGAAGSRDLQEALRNLGARGDVPGSLGETGVQGIEGPDLDLFGGDDPREQTTFQRFAQILWLAATDPDRAEAQLGGTALGRAAGI
jgi:hypothetical protein